MKALALAAVAALHATPLLAQSELDPIQITAAREAQRVTETLAPVVIITRAEIERSNALDLAELLRFHAGLDVARSGGPGQATSVFIRGAESNHTLVLVDGVRVNPGTIGGAAFQNLSPELIERIEIVKGPRSSQWGADALGGVIHVITRRTASGTTLDARALAGNDATWDAALRAGWHGSNLEGSLAIGQFATRGFPARSDATEDTGHDRTSGSVALATAFGAARLSARHWHAEGTTDYHDFSLNRVDQDFANSASAVELSAPLDAGFDVRAAVTHATDEVRQNQSADYALTRRAGIEAGGTWHGAAHVLTFGAQAQREEADSLVFGSGFDVRTDTWAAFAQDRLASGPHQMLLAARYTDHEAFGSHVTGSLEYGYEVWEGARAIVAAGSGFRAPDATDRFGFGGDPELAPEESRNVEFSWRQVIGAHTVALGAFRNRIDNLIEFVCLDAFCFTGENRNVARARIQGVEAQWRWEPGAWTVVLAALVQDPIDEATGERLARRAGKSATASIVRRIGAFDIGVDALAQGAREDSAFSATVLPGYALGNVTVAWRAGGGWTVQARVENVLDRDYQTAAGFRAPGRGGFVTLRYALR